MAKIKPVVPDGFRVRDPYADTTAQPAPKGSCQCCGLHPAEPDLNVGSRYFCSETCMGRYLKRLYGDIKLEVATCPVCKQRILVRGRRKHPPTCGRRRCKYVVTDERRGRLKNVHYRMYSGRKAACGKFIDEDRRLTDDLSAVTCPNCKRSKVYRKRLARCSTPKD